MHADKSLRCWPRVALCLQLFRQVGTGEVGSEMFSLICQHEHRDSQRRYSAQKA